MMEYLSKAHPIKTFSVSPENLTGGKGRGGMAAEGTGSSCARDLGIGWKISPSLPLKAGETITLADVRAQGAIRHIWITPAGGKVQGRLLILRVYWDGSERPAVEVPLGDFFATADFGEYRQLSSLAVCVNPRQAMNCYWEMPFRKGFKVTLESLETTDCVIYYQIDCEEKEISPDALYFHAEFRRTNPVPYKGVHTLLDGVRGNGQYVGTYIHWGVNNNGWWGEGEIKFYIDGDTDYPTVCGTGTEDYFCGSHDFDVDGHYVEFCSSYSGMSKVGKTDDCYQSQRRFDMYRWHIQDPVYFEKDLRVTIQALGWRKDHRYLPLMDDISSVCYWYFDHTEPTGHPLPDADGLEII